MDSIGFSMIATAFVGFMISSLILRWALGIPTMIKQLKIQSVNMNIMQSVICRLAEQQGLSKEELEDIYKESMVE